jgi:hypothetical protein
MLPVDIVVDTGALVVGSDATPTVTITEFKNANGTYEAMEVRMHGIHPHQSDH